MASVSQTGIVPCQYLADIELILIKLNE